MEKTENKRKVFVGLSGGVDSSVAALLLQREGYEVVGAHMTCWEGCDTNEDRRDAMRVATKLNIPFHLFDFKREYKEKVFDYMIREYGAGRTPNPDVMCNSEIKFGIFLNRAMEMGADYIATGHYVRKVENYLLSAIDSSKDQSYFLWRLTPEQISKSLFPIGGYLKTEVRKMAKRASLITADKKDSQGLCFVGKVDFQDFLRELLPKKEGVFINSGGEVLGKHDGAHFFTPGQRHGIRLGGFREPLYVAETDLKTNTVLVAEGTSDPVLYKKEIEITEKTLPENINEELFARIRYRQPLQRCEIEGNKVIFNLPQRGVAAGQSIVFYSKDRALLGGGIIGK